MRNSRNIFKNTLLLFFSLLLIVFIPALPGAKESESLPLESQNDPQTTPETLSDSSDNIGDSELNDPKQEETELSETPEMSMMSMYASGKAGEGETGISVPIVNTFEFTGAATSKIPILVPPGRTGVAPNLYLRYNSYMRNGWLGVGWSLDMGAIQRSTKRGVDYTANVFVATINGSSSELVPRDDWGPDYYGAKIEETFLKYYFNQSTEGWEVTTKDGTVYYYGTTADSRQDNTHGIFKWCLDKVEDTNGNYMTVSYTKDQGQIYLDRIDYAGNGSLAPTNYVRFYLEDRPDPMHMFTTNSEVITDQRLKSVEVVTDGLGVRAYSLEYIASQNTTSFSLLSNT